MLIESLDNLEALFSNVSILYFVAQNTIYNDRANHKERNIQPLCPNKVNATVVQANYQNTLQL